MTLSSSIFAGAAILAAVGLLPALRRLIQSNASKSSDVASDTYSDLLLADRNLQWLPLALAAFSAVITSYVLAVRFALRFTLFMQAAMMQ